jgi:protein-S-isoprenylcysteine O-methyltransferase Ste14
LKPVPKRPRPPHQTLERYIRSYIPLDCIVPFGAVIARAIAGVQSPKSCPVNISLNQRALAANIVVIVAMTALLFVPAGTLRYWQAWTFLAVYLVASLTLTAWLMANDPKLLARRMRGGPTAEKAPAQKIIMWIVSACFIGLLVVPALDHRFGWSRVPGAVALAGDAMVVIGCIAVFFVFRENSFTSSTIEIADDQKVISSGPYARVRHPMYAGALVWLLGIPLALGSWWGLLVLAVMMPALIWRVFDEEEFLSRNLPGYPEYKAEVRYRLLPGVW